MKESVDYSLFELRFRDYNRLSHFPTGLRALFDHLEQLEEEMGEELELDVIGLCCEFHEMTIGEALRDYGVADLEELRDDCHTVIEVNEDTVIVGE